MKRVLIVEDSKMLAILISRRIAADLKFERDVAPTFKHARQFIEDPENDYFLAVVDLHLPDAPKGEIVDFVMENNIPVIVFTSHFSDEIRETMLTKNVVDYIVKEGGPYVIDYLISSIDRFYKNQYTKILIVDDSQTSRASLRHLLEGQKFHILEAGNGEEALGILRSKNDIKLVITDYNMPGMDGFQLVSRIRETHPKNRLPIIGISAYGTSLLSARFLKNGASDFITKPFLEEELFCRINQNLEMLEHIQTIKEISNIDYLTGIYNRRYFFQFGQKLLENAKRGNLHLTAAIIDIDGMKRINERWGYEAGDQVVYEIAQMLNRNFRKSDMVARFGGKEFAVLATNMDLKHTATVFERIRATIEYKRIPFGNRMLSVTVSIGVTTKLEDSLKKMIKCGDSFRRKAKMMGKNRVIIDNREQSSSR
jgi:diguanylate cyclase (GGDEF)-like protein